MIVLDRFADGQYGFSLKGLMHIRRCQFNDVAYRPLGQGAEFLLKRLGELLFNFALGTV